MSKLWVLSAFEILKNKMKTKKLLFPFPQSKQTNKHKKSGLCEFMWLALGKMDRKWQSRSWSPKSALSTCPVFPSHILLELWNSDLRAVLYWMRLPQAMPWGVHGPWIPNPASPSAWEFRLGVKVSPPTAISLPCWIFCCLCGSKISRCIMEY